MRRWVVDAVVHGAPLLAYLALWNVHDHGYRLDVVVEPAWRNRGVGSQLLDFVIGEARGVRAASLQARAYDDQADALHLLATRDFHETIRMTGLVLDDVASVNLEPFTELPQVLAARGIEISTFADELRDDPESWQKLRDTNQAAQFGWPDPDPNPDGSPHAPESVERFRARAAEFGMIPDACFVARSGERYVGYSALTVNDRTRTQAGSGGTAVRPEYRGLGVATALKACCVRWARANGVQRLATASANPFMVRVNERFGFRRSYVEVRLVRRMGATPLGVLAAEAIHR